PTRAQTSRVPRINNQISGGCVSVALQARSEFRRISRLQGARFLSPVSFGKTKEIGSPPVDYRPRKATPKQKSKKGVVPGLAAGGHACPVSMACSGAGMWAWALVRRVGCRAPGHQGNPKSWGA
ncbi:MAG: hypothetical protein Q4B46_02605, partial [Comamonadaceae bacterium]|nr:hypothetical protein [Comamonadaceae bacterium]